MARIANIGGGVIPAPLPTPIGPIQPATLFLVSGFTPASGVPGTQVTINGSGFLGSTVVRFGGHDARSFTVFSDSQIIAEVPPDAVDGPITVGGPNGSVSSSQSFDVLASSPLPSVSGFNPLQGQAGSQVTLSGQNLSPVNAVTLGGVNCPVLAASATSLLITIPAGASSARFTVVTPAGSALSTGTFVVIQAASLPRVDGFSPVSGPVGTTVAINGANFTGTSEVDFGGVPSNLFSAGTNQITAQVPPGALSGPIRVSTNLGSATSATSFQVQAVSNQPTLTSFSPLQGAPGTQVTLNGSNLSGATVLFNGVVATVLSNTASQILTVVPTGASSGPITATTPAGTAQSQGSFTVVAGMTTGTFNLTLQSLGDIAPLAEGSNGPFVFNIRSGKELKERVTVDNPPPGDVVTVSLVVQTFPAGVTSLAALGISTSLKPTMFPASSPDGAILDIKTSLTTPPFENLTFRVEAASQFPNVTYKPAVIVINNRAPIALDPRPFDLKAAQGGEAVYTINVDRNKEAAGLSVAFSVNPDDLPAGSTPTFEPPSTNGNSAMLKISIPLSAKKKTYMLKVKGEAALPNGAKVFVEPGDANLTVTDQALIIVARDPRQTVAPGQSATFNFDLLRPVFKGTATIQAQTGEPTITLKPVTQSVSGDSFTLTAASQQMTRSGSYEIDLKGLDPKGKVLATAAVILEVAEIKVTLEPPTLPVKVSLVSSGSAMIGVKRTAAGMPVTGVPVKVEITNRDDLKGKGIILSPQDGQMTVTGDSAVFDFQIEQTAKAGTYDVQLQASIQGDPRGFGSFLLQVVGSVKIELDDLKLDVPVGGSAPLGFKVIRNNFSDTFTLEGEAANLPPEQAGSVTITFNPPSYGEGDDSGTLTVTLLGTSIPAGEGFFVLIGSPGNPNVQSDPLFVTVVPAKNPAPPKGGRNPVPKLPRPPRLPRGTDPLG